MNVGAVKTDLARILPLRSLFLEEIDAQVRYDACHGRGWTDSYLLTADEAAVGYGAIKGLNEVADRDTVFEFYVSPPWRRHAGALFRALLDASGARHVECQSNDRLLAGMLFEFAQNVRSDVVLFEAHAVTDLAFPGGLVRARRESDRIFDHTVEPVGDCVLEVQGEIVATGGFFLHYNPPFADLYMEVSEPHRRRGAGSYLVQEVIRRCYLAGRVPAARCGLDNVGSRATLTKAGLRPCGFMLAGDVRNP